MSTEKRLYGCSLETLANLIVDRAIFKTDKVICVDLKACAQRLQNVIRNLSAQLSDIVVTRGATGTLCAMSPC